jgi:hypothetical protein
VEKVVGGIEAMDLETNFRARHKVEQALKPFYVRRLLDWVNEALIPKPGGTGRFSHWTLPKRRQHMIVVVFQNSNYGN